MTGPFGQLRGAWLYRRYKRTGDLGALHAAVRVFRAAVPGSPPRQRATCLSNLASVLDVLFEQTGDQAALQEAITAGRAAVTTVPAARNHALYLSRLGDRLHTWYELTGDLDALHESVSAGRASVAAAEGSPLRALVLSDLATKLAQRDLHEILGWLWDTTTGPILAALDGTGGPRGQEPWPRLWWCPVGVMARLPLHAAGHHEDVAAGVPAPRTVLDRVVSSYTTTVRTLAYARQARANADAGPALVVSMPVTPGAPALPSVPAEASRLTALLRQADTTVLSGPEATRDSVLGVLPGHRVAHFACHGVSDLANPGASHLLLHDHATQPLTVTEISRLHLPRADLAYLSACSTTVTDQRLADEAVHITAAFQVAGYRNVVGTLWPVGDRTASRVAADVYTYLTDAGENPPDTAKTAIALHHATRELRRRRLGEPTLWAAHIHVGV